MSIPTTGGIRPSTDSPTLVREFLGGILRYALGEIFQNDLATLSRGHLASSWRTSTDTSSSRSQPDDLRVVDPFAHGRRRGGGSRERYVLRANSSRSRGVFTLPPGGNAPSRAFVAPPSRVPCRRRRFPVRSTSISGIPRESLLVARQMRLLARALRA